MITSFVAGIVLGLSAGFSPGPFMTLVISQSLEHGSREGVKVAFAPLITDAPIILLCLFVLTRLAHSDLFLGGIALGGGLFLCHLAFESFRASGIDPEAQGAAPNSLRKGILVNFLNPNPYLFWFTVGAPILVQGWSGSPFKALAFLGGFYGCLIGAKTLVALSLGASRRFLTGKPYLCLMRFLGLLQLVFALLLFWNALGYFGLPGASA